MVAANTAFRNTDEMAPWTTLGLLPLVPRREPKEPARQALRDLSTKDDNENSNHLAASSTSGARPLTEDLLPANRMKVHTITLSAATHNRGLTLWTLLGAALMSPRRVPREPHR